MKYIELNPVRACMVNLPGDYRWSSYCHNAGFKQIGVISCHPIYLALGKTASERREAYMSLFRYDLSGLDLREIRDTWQTGTPLGNDYFRDNVEKQLNCKVGQCRRGRRKTKVGDTLKGFDPLNLFYLGRHLVAAKHYRNLKVCAFSKWSKAVV